MSIRLCAAALALFAAAPAVALGAAAKTDMLVANPAVESPTRISDATWYAAHGGFLLGNAQRCGVAEERVARTGQLVQALIKAAAKDDEDSDDATTKFAQFFLATAVKALNDTKLVPSCKTVVAEFQRLEQHQPGPGGETHAALGNTASPGFRLSDGE